MNKSMLQFQDMEKNNVRGQLFVWDLRDKFGPLMRFCVWGGVGLIFFILILILFF